MFTAESYITMMYEEGSHVTPVLERLYIGLTGQKVINKFTLEEAEICLKLGEDEELKKIMDKEVAFSIFVFELMKFWTMSVPKEKRPYLGVSDKHFKIGGNAYWQQMLKLKSINGYKHKQKKEIIDDSKEVAKAFFEWHWRKVMNDEN
jgi:hypothetical protein